MQNKDRKQNTWRGIAINPCHMYKDIFVKYNVKCIAVYLLNVNIHSNFNT